MNGLSIGGAIDMFPAPKLTEAPPNLRSRRNQAEGPPHFRASNLLLTFEQMAAHLGDQLVSALQGTSADNAIDAFLLAAGINQIAEDYLQRDVLALSKAAKHLAALRRPFGQVLPPLTSGLRRVGLRWRQREPSHRSVTTWQEEFTELVQELAGCVTRGNAGSALRREAIRRRIAQGFALLHRAALFPRPLRSSVVRLPAAFRSFDQRPEDFESLARAFERRHPRRAFPLLVVGLRTSGSYLASLLKAYLENAGYRDVQAVTLRPGHDWGAVQRRQLARIQDGRGLALLTDDPPRTGEALARAAKYLERLGMDRDSIAILVATDDSSPLPEAVTAYETFALQRSEWSIERALSVDRVGEVLRALLPGRTIRCVDRSGAVESVTVSSVDSVERVPLAPLRDADTGRPQRRHLRALFRVQVRNQRQVAVEHHVYVKGIGLGYLGRHAAIVSEALEGLLPQMYGERDGLLFREWLPEEWRGPAATDQNILDFGIASYVVRRRAGLAASADASTGLEGRNPVWQLIAHRLGELFGRARPALRMLMHRVARRLLKVSSPCVVDGSMALEHWFTRPNGTLCKTDYDERAFSNLDASCYDAAFDVAGAAADARLRQATVGSGPVSPEGVRRAYEALTREVIDDERWLLYNIHHLATAQDAWRDVLRTHRASSTPAGVAAYQLEAIRRALACAFAEYFARHYVHLPGPPNEGPLCGLDIDGVIESPWFGCPATSPAGAQALRSLQRHGYRPVLVSGRSLDEVKQRCVAFRLAGAVAEYGSVVYDHLTGKEEDQVSIEDHRSLERLRAALGCLDGTFFDTAYRHSVRAFTYDAKARRRALAPTTIAAAMERAGAEGLQVIQGYFQTDFVSASVDKGSGVRRLARMLSPNERTTAAERPPLAVAVGDGAPDVSLLTAAARAFAPANAEAELLEGCALRGILLRPLARPGQSGLLQAVAAFLGHSPGGCALCRPSPFTREARLLLTLFTARDSTRCGKAFLALRLVWQLGLDAATRRPIPTPR
jgi:hydroxymethylpyrimidine pyrophosphatase-like HAD family hydrolase